jgi:hypothetical protein
MAAVAPKKPKGKDDFKSFNLDKEELGAPPQGPDAATTQKMLLEKAAAHAKETGQPQDPIVRNPESEVDLATVAELVTPREEKADDPSTPIKEQPLVIKRPSTPKPKSLSREDTSIFEKERIDEVAIHEYALNDEYDLLEKLIGLKYAKSDIKGKNNIRFLDSRDHHGNTALMNACWKGHKECAEFLLKSGASKDLQNFYGWTAMMWAVANNHQRVVQLLLEWDVNLRLVNPVDRAAIDFADDPDIRKMLLSVLNKPIQLLSDGPAVPDLSLI